MAEIFENSDEIDPYIECKRQVSENNEPFFMAQCLVRHINYERAHDNIYETQKEFDDFGPFSVQIVK